ncbi:hypothetical protein GCM10023231_08870 [Olivibacter ginsenosidimutans]|uniref:HTH cro/C1-type domain-containing protein n=1 Tax=Olivibacter ginsenosidimutans TaxID=1176537 RepID=A0ABP9AM77_9SPHI
MKASKRAPSCFFEIILCLVGEMDEDLENFKINLGKRIKALREEQNLTQPELAALLGKDYQALGRIENGRVNPSSFMVYQIALALKVTTNEIFDFSRLQE